MNKERNTPEYEAVLEAAHLLENTFIQRKDMFASQLEDGRYVAIKEPLTDKHVALHLEGKITLGAYLLAPDNTTTMMAIDADDPDDGLHTLSRLATVLDVEGVPTYLETSRRGGHLWFFFDHPRQGERVRAFGRAVMDLHSIQEVELYPKQDRLDGGPGSLVRLPFGRHKLTGQRYPFIYPDGELLAPSVREQIRVLSAHQNVPEAIFDAYAGYEAEKKKSHPPKRLVDASGSGEVEKVKAAIPLLDFLSGYLDLKPVASGAVGLCPFHPDHHPSFGVNKEGNYWQCFAGCGGGTIIDFWMKWRKIEFPQAVNELADILGVTENGRDTRTHTGGGTIYQAE